MGIDTAIIAGLFLLISGAAALVGFRFLVSDIQIIIVLQGVLFFGLFLILVFQGVGQWHLARTVDRIRKDVQPAPPSAPPGAAASFNEALQLYRQQRGLHEPTDAIRELATTALRDQSFLR